MDTTVNEPSPGGRGRLFVLQTGLLTSAASLFGVYLLNRYAEDVNIMGWYLYFILPVGAVLVGLLAGSGYGIASWFTGYKIGRGTLAIVIVLMIGTYFAAQYIEFRQLDLVYEESGERVGFFTWFHYSAVSFAWQQRDGTMGEPMGLWGYAFRGLEIVGFALGGLIVPAVMMGKPYCTACQRYMKTRQLATVPASVPEQNIKKMSDDEKAAYTAEQEARLQNATQQFDELVALAQAGDAAGFNQRVSELAAFSGSAKKLPARLSLSLVHCKECHAATLHATLVVGQGDKIQTTPLAVVEIPAEVVAQM